MGHPPPRERFSPKSPTKLPHSVAQRCLLLQRTADIQGWATGCGFGFVPDGITVACGGAVACGAPVVVAGAWVGRGLRGDHAVGVPTRQCPSHAPHRHHHIHRSRRVRPRRAGQRRAVHHLHIRATHATDAHRRACHEARTGERDRRAAAEEAGRRADRGEERLEGTDRAEGGGAGDAALIETVDVRGAGGGVADGGITVGDGGGTGEQGMVWVGPPLLPSVPSSGVRG